MNFKNYVSFLRPFTLLPPALGMLSGSFIAAKYSLEQNLGWAQITLPIIIGAIAASILNGASNSINQIYDYEIDKINKPSRLLPSKQITLKEA